MIFLALILCLLRTQVLTLGSELGLLVFYAFACHELHIYTVTFAGTYYMYILNHVLYLVRYFQQRKVEGITRSSRIRTHQHH
jgi:hypothetical protein